MITDNITNVLYLSELLLTKYPTFWNSFSKSLNENKIKYHLLKDTSDVWAVDYMPIQKSIDDFILFTFDPIYYKYKKYQSWKTDNVKACQNIDLKYERSSIIIDGGNVTKGEKMVIMTDRIFDDNKEVSKKELVKQIETLLDTQVIVIPQLPGDETGHSDGMVRFIDSKTVLLNDFSKDRNKTFKIEVKKALIDAQLDIIEVPYGCYDNNGFSDDSGDYVNFLQMQGVVFVPVYERQEDEAALRIIEQAFNQSKIIPIVASELAKGGGGLNCISWNIKTKV